MSEGVKHRQQGTLAGKQESSDLTGLKRKGESSLTLSHMGKTFVLNMSPYYSRQLKQLLIDVKGRGAGELIDTLFVQLDSSNRRGKGKMAWVMDGMYSHPIGRGAERADSEVAKAVICALALWAFAKGAKEIDLGEASEDIANWLSAMGAVSAPERLGRNGEIMHKVVIYASAEENMRSEFGERTGLDPRSFISSL